MPEDMRWLLDSGILSDVELVAGHRTFKAHKNILAARYAILKKPPLSALLIRHQLPVLPGDVRVQVQGGYRHTC